MDETFTLILLSLAMLVGCYLAGSIPLAFSFSEVRWIPLISVKATTKFNHCLKTMIKKVHLEQLVTKVVAEIRTLQSLPLTLSSRLTGRQTSWSDSM